MYLQDTLRTVRLVVAALCAFSAAALGQTSAPDSAAQSSSESQPGRADSASIPATTAVDTPTANPGNPLPGDSLGSAADSTRAGTRDSAAARPDSSRAASDSSRKAQPRDSTRSTVAPPPPPADSILTAACGGTGSTGIAEDLLVVLFAPDARARQRAAIAKSVKGKLVSSAEPGLYYVRLPSGGGEAGLRAAADQLSRMAEVRQVGSRACPLPSAGNPR